MLNLTPAIGRLPKKTIIRTSFSKSCQPASALSRPIHFGNNLKAGLDAIDEDDISAINDEMVAFKNVWRLAKLGYNFSFGGIQMFKLACTIFDGEEGDHRAKQMLLNNTHQANTNWTKLIETVETYLDLFYETISDSNSAPAQRLVKQLPPKNKLLTTFYTLCLPSLSTMGNTKLKDSIHKKLLSFGKEDRDLELLLDFYKEVAEMPSNQDEQEKSVALTWKKEFFACLSNMIDDASDLQAIEALLDAVPDADKQLILKQLQPIYSNLSKDAATRTQIFKMQHQGYNLQGGEYKPVVGVPTQENVKDKQDTSSSRPINSDTTNKVNSLPDFSSKIATAVQNALSLKQSDHAGGGLVLLNTVPDLLKSISASSQNILSEYSNKTGRPIIAHAIEDLTSIETLKVDMVRSKLRGEKPIVLIRLSPHGNLETQVAIWRSLKQFEDTKSTKAGTLNDGEPIYIGDILYVVTFSKEATPKSKALAQLLGGLKSRAVNETFTNKENAETNTSQSIQPEHSMPFEDTNKSPIITNAFQSIKPEAVSETIAISQNSADKVKAAIRLALSLQTEEHTGGGLVLLDSPKQSLGNQTKPIIQAFAQQEKRPFIEAEINGTDSVRNLTASVLRSKLKGEAPVVHIRILPSTDANTYVALWRSLKEFYDTKSTRLPEINEGNPVYLGNTFFAISYDETLLPPLKGVAQLYGGVKSRAIKESIAI